MDATTTTTPTYTANPVGDAISGRVHTPSNSVVHYLSEFTLAAKNGDQGNAFTIATDLLLRWAERKKSLPGFALREEQHGGDAVAPEAWAFHMQHRESGKDYRRYWHIDASLQRRVAHFDVRVSVSYALDYTFVGWAPAPPEPSAPNFVFEWLGHPALVLRSGQFPIAALMASDGTKKSIKERINAMAVSPEGADKLARLIFDPNRGLPVLLISGEVNPITFPLSPNEMQRLLFGTCYIVWAPPSPGWWAAWQAHFPSGFGCRLNSVRLYQPGASRTAANDSMRHRFFTDDEIVANGGARSFLAMIRDGLTRRLLAPRHGRISTCEDVLVLRAAEDFSLQRSKLRSKDEEIALYEAEYQRLLAKNQVDDQLLQEADAELKQAKSEVSALRPHAEELAYQLEQLKTAEANRQAQFSHTELLLRFYKNEATAVDQLNAISALYPDAVCVLQSAIRSAEAADGFEHLDELRELLLKLVTTYRQVLIDGKGNQEACRVFGRKEFTTKEADNLTRSGRDARTFSYNGKLIFMEQHLKIGVKDSEAHCLRVHFHWDVATKQVVIGHCGKHLPL